ncbi:hypothetical protein CEQ21_08135 [Niallia circulans]|uniref:Uncharacterized protein n=1 Tax=Niallia circulans TaxID=1397 RepID=A0A553SF30_NIACI|nr:hypothetical protein CEQ21_08135 [Niallia circulans]
MLITQLQCNRKQENHLLNKNVRQKKEISSYEAQFLKQKNLSGFILIVLELILKEELTCLGKIMFWH